MNEPHITQYIVTDFVRKPGDEPLLAIHAEWPDQRFVFLVQSLPGMPEEWRDMFRTWIDVRDGFAPFRVEQVDASTFRALLDRQHILAPTVEELAAVRDSASSLDVPITRTNASSHSFDGPVVS